MYDKCSLKYKGYDIYITGDSLGGSDAQYVGALRDVPTVTFNPCGIGHFIERKDIRAKTDKIINYCNTEDVVPSYNTSHQLGGCYKLETKNKALGATVIGNHMIKNQKPITKQEEIPKENLGLKWNEIKPHIEKGVNTYNQIKSLPETAKNNINHAINIYLQNALEHTPQFMMQLFNNYLDSFNQTPPEAKPVSYGGKIYIKEYRRMDGTRVEGHWRSLPDDAVTPIKNLLIWIKTNWIKHWIFIWMCINRSILLLFVLCNSCRRFLRLFFRIAGGVKLHCIHTEILFRNYMFPAFLFILIFPPAFTHTFTHTFTPPLPTFTPR